MDTARLGLGALALVVLLTSGGAGHASERAEPTRPATPRVAVPTPIHLAGLPTGAAPRIAFIRGRHLDFEVGDYVLNRPDGTTLRLPRGTWSTWAPMGRGAIGSFGTEAGPEVQVVTGAGRVTSTMVRHFGLAVSPDRSIVGWLIGRLNTPHVVEGGGSRTFDLPHIGHGLRIGTISGASTCKERYPEGGGCTVFVNTAGDHGVWVSTSHGIVAEVGPMRSVTDVDRRGRVVGRTRDPDPCSGMWSAGGTERLWKTCDSRLVAFAPGGGHVLGTGPVDQRFGDVHVVSLYDDRGELAASYSSKGGDHLDDVAWEDSTHVLATVFVLGAASHCPGSCRGHWAIVRLGLHGTIELAGPVVRGRIDYPAWSLPIT